MIKAGIVGFGTSIPEKILTNFDLEKMVDTSDQWIIDRTGIHERRIAPDHVGTDQLAIEAAKNALNSAQIDPSEIDLVIVSTSTPERLLPTTACIIQRELGLRKVGAFDLLAACCGFIYGLSIANSMIQSGALSTILVVSSEKMSSIIDWTDRNICVLFGDGAGAAILKANYPEHQILSTHLFANGNYPDLLALDLGNGNYLKMRGNELFKHAVYTMADAGFTALKANNLTTQDVDLLIPHQANIRIMDAVAKKMNIPKYKVLITVDKYGNTSSATIPITLADAQEKGFLKKGQYIILTAFGGGLTWASALLRW